MLPSGDQKQAPQKRHPRLVFIVLACLLLALVVLSFNFGRYWIDVGKILKIIAAQVFPITQTWPTKEATVVLSIRFPRIAAAVVIGGALALAGSGYQAVFKNPLVSPDILGAAAGASLGAAIAIFSGLRGVWVQVFAFIFGLGTVWLASAVGSRIKKDPTLSLILSGILIGSLCSALVSLIKFVADPRDVLPAITYWLMGSLANIKLTDLGFALIPMLLGAIPLLLLSWRINILSMGDDEAKALGVETTKLRNIVIVCATILTSSAIAIGGLIGWVGLVIPHLTRMLIGPDNRLLMPASVLTGGLFLLLVDDVARTLTTAELPLGVLTAVIGAPFFIFLMLKEGGSTQ